MSTAASKPHVPVAAKIAGLIAADLPRDVDRSVKLASRRELADRYGVSMPTVTNALKLLRKKDLVYWVPGKGMYTGAGPRDGSDNRCFTVGVFGWFDHVLSPRSNSADTYRLNLLRDLTNVGMEEGYQLTLIPQERGSVFDMDVLDRLTFDGLILKDLVDPEATIRLLRERGVPIITDSIRYVDYGVSYFGHNNVSMIDDMVRAFAERGHRRIASLVVQTSTPRQNEMMRNQFYVSLMNAGCIYNACEYYCEFDWDRWRASHDADALVEFGYRFASELLRRDDRPTAFFAWAPQIADGIKSAAAELGLSVPGDVSILTDSADADFVGYSTFVQQHEELARGLLRQVKQVAADPLLHIKGDLKKILVDKGTIAECSVAYMD